MEWVAIIVIGAGVGYLGGLFGKGGSAVATPLLTAIGVPPIIAVASPLPATVPATLVPTAATGGWDWSTPRWCAGASPWACPPPSWGRWPRWPSTGPRLVRITEVLVAAIGAKVLLWPEPTEVVRDVPHRRARLVAVALAVGLLGGLLANAGGFLLVPLYLAVLKLPIKTALAGSLAVASALAIPGTIVHAALGHIDWTVTLVFAAASIPMSSLGARTALRMDTRVLERLYGAGLLAMGVALFVLG